jgi:hypothetical protein
MSGSADTGEPNAPYRPSLPGEPGYQSPPSHHDMTQPGSIHMPGMHDFMMDTFATPSPSQVASLFDDEAGMSHGVEGHQGPDGDAGVAHDSTGPRDLDGLAGPQGQDVENPNTHRLQPDQLLLIGKCVCVCVCIYIYIYIANFFL